jgi:hypothetical protein
VMLFDIGGTQVGSRNGKTPPRATQTAFASMYPYVVSPWECSEPDQSLDDLASTYAAELQTATPVSTATANPVFAPTRTASEQATVDAGVAEFRTGVADDETASDTHARAMIVTIRQYYACLNAESPLGVNSQFSAPMLVRQFGDRTVEDFLKHWRNRANFMQFPAEHYELGEVFAASQLFTIIQVELLAPGKGVVYLTDGTLSVSEKHQFKSEYGPYLLRFTLVKTSAGRWLIDGISEVCPKPVNRVCR